MAYSVLCTLYSGHEVIQIQSYTLRSDTLLCYSTDPIAYWPIIMQRLVRRGKRGEVTWWTEETARYLKSQD